MSTPEHPKRSNTITVSRDALRADLAEMELRLRVWIGEQLSEKADAAALLALEARVALTEALSAKFAAGDFTPAQDRAFAQLMDENLRAHTDSGWTQRQRWIAVAALIISILAVATSIFMAVRLAHHAG